MANLREIDYAEVERLAALGCSQEQIGASFGLSRRTIGRRLQDDERFQQSYDAGRQQLCESVSTLLLDACKNGSVEAMKFALERQCGWHKLTKQELELSGKSGQPMINIQLTAAAPTLQ